MTSEDVITEVIRREGGYVNHPLDRGGPTKYGITLKTLAAWRGRPVTAEDVFALTEAERYKVETIKREEPKIGRNDPCPCGSGKKFKLCHGQ